MVNGVKDFANVVPGDQRESGGLAISGGAIRVESIVIHALGHEPSDLVPDVVIEPTGLGQRMHNPCGFVRFAAVHVAVPRPTSVVRLEVQQHGGRGLDAFVQRVGTGCDEGVDDQGVVGEDAVEAELAAVVALPNVRHQFRTRDRWCIAAVEAQREQEAEAITVAAWALQLRQNGVVRGRPLREVLARGSRRHGNVDAGFEGLLGQLSGEVIQCAFGVGFAHAAGKGDGKQEDGRKKSTAHRRRQTGSRMNAPAFVRHNTNGLCGARTWTCMASGEFDIYQTAGGTTAITSPVQRQILQALSQGELQLPDIVELTGKAKSTLSSIHMKELLARQIIEELPHPTDSRRKVYRLVGKPLKASSTNIKELQEDAAKTFERHALPIHGLPLASIFQVLDAAPARQDGALRKQADALGRKYAHRFTATNVAGFASELTRFVETERLAEHLQLDFEALTFRCRPGSKVSDLEADRLGLLLAGFAEGVAAARGLDGVAFQSSAQDGVFQLSPNRS